jgi:MtaA/CmuA family methyltransferase
MTKDSLFKLVTERSAAGSPMFSPLLMQFAAHQVGKTYSDFYLDHRVLVEANIQCQNDFQIDTVSCISDPGREAEAFGGKFDYPPEAVPHCVEYAVNFDSDPASLPRPDVHRARRTLDRIEAIKLYTKRVSPDTLIIGWVEGPLASACDIMDLSEVLMAMMTEEDFTTKLLDKTLQTAKDFAASQIEAGCHIVGIGDAICSQISPDQYEQWIEPRHRELVEWIHEKGALAKIHICGNITHLLGSLKRVGMDILDLDWQVDLQKAYEILGDDVIRCGNLDPAGVIENKEPAEIKRLTMEIIEQERGRPFMLSGGCEITPLTPPENLKAMIPGDS